MLEIKTISNQVKAEFDEEVNSALRDGWELARRDCLLVGPEHRAVLYAELERIVDDLEEEEGAPCDFAQWIVKRDPQRPYHCGNCGYATNARWATCPGCSASMENMED